MKWHVGTIGFGYQQWQGVFYPPQMRSASYMGHYSEFFDSVEIDSTFYGTPAVAKVVRWRQAVGERFTFCPKVPRLITHELRLQSTAVAEMAAFVSAVAHFQHKLGAVLIQLPPDFTTAEQPALKHFLAQLPTHEMRFAVEFRHRSWEVKPTADLLYQYNVCWLAADYVIMPHRIHPTANFLYLRFLGRHGRYQTKNEEKRNPTADITRWHGQVMAHKEKFEHIFAYFNNDFAGYSPKSANRLKQLAGLPTRYPKLPTQARLF